MKNTINFFVGKALRARSLSWDRAGERGVTRVFSTTKDFDIGDKPAPGSPFHLAVPVHNMDAAREFYGGVLGLKEGRRSQDKWQDYSLFGHQLVCHYVERATAVLTTIIL